MAMGPSRYPADWPQIRKRILRRAGGQEDDPRLGAKCEWCGLRNYSVGQRDKGRGDTAGRFVGAAGNIVLDLAGQGLSYPSLQPLNYAEAREIADGLNESPDDDPRYGRYIVIMLTTAHLGVPHPDGRPGDPHDKMDVRPENLAALCQKCHLNHDRDEHIYNAALTRRRRRIEAGQLELAI